MSNVLESMAAGRLLRAAGLSLALLATPQAVAADDGAPALHPRPPESPHRGPDASEVTAPSGPAADVNTSDDRHATGGVGDDARQRLRDLAQRLGEPPDRPAAARASTPPSEADALPAEMKVSQGQAAESNNQSLDGGKSGDRLLGARGQAGDPTGGGLLPQRSGDEAGAGSSWVDILAALGVVIGLIFAARALLRKLGGPAAATGSNPAVQVLLRTSVAPRNHILLLRIGARVLVVGDSAAGLRTLAQLDDPDEVADLLALVSSDKPSSISAGFRQVLQGFNGAYRKGDTPEAQDAADDGFQIDRTRDRLGGLLGRLRQLGSRSKEVER